MQDRNVHDNSVYAYSVFADARRIVLHTEYRDVPPVEYTDVVFSGVVAYHFEGSLQHNILFDVFEDDVETVLKEYSWLFARLKNYGWPSIDYDDLPDLCRSLQAKNIRAYRIGSSYGLGGFVFSSSSEYVRRETRAYPEPEGRDEHEHGGRGESQPGSSNSGKTVD